MYYNTSAQLGYKHQVRCFYTNAQSLNKKMDELRTIVGISETWATESSDMNLNGYHSPIRCDRADGRHGGVALFYTLKTLSKCNSVQKLKLTNLRICMAWCTVQLEHSDKLLIGVCYRSSNSCEENNNKLLQLIRTMNNAAKASRVLIIGD